MPGDYLGGLPGGSQYSSTRATKPEKSGICSVLIVLPGNPLVHPPPGYRVHAGKVRMFTVQHIGNTSYI